MDPTMPRPPNLEGAEGNHLCIPVWPRTNESRQITSNPDRRMVSPVTHRRWRHGITRCLTPRDTAGKRKRPRRLDPVHFQKMKSSSICSSPGLGSAFHNTMPAAGLAASDKPNGRRRPGISWPPGLHPLLLIQAGSGQTQAERNAKNQGQVPDRRQQEPVSRCGPGVPDGPGHVGERSIGAME